MAQGAWRVLGPFVLVELELLRLQRDVVQVGRGEVLLADRAVALGAEPQHHARLAELVPAHGEDAGEELGLADDAKPGLVGLGPRVAEVEDLSVSARSWRPSARKDSR